MSQSPKAPVVESTTRLATTAQNRMFADARQEAKNKETARAHLLAIQLILSKRPI
jgi:hypothetical protein